MNPDSGDQAGQILVVAGDPSGDERAAEVLAVFKEHHPDHTFYGIGGPRLAAQGVELLYNLDDVQVFGFIEALLNYFRLKRIFNSVIHEFERRSSRFALLVDFGGFNLRLAKALREHGSRILYYVSPQVWATRQERAKIMAETVNRLAVLFSFEKTFYSTYGLEADHVGHPLLDSIQIPDRKETPQPDKDSFELAIMPGSRTAEIKRHGLVLREVIEKASSKHDMRVSIIAAPGREESLREIFSGTDASLTSAENKYQVLSAADVVIAASGTAALEIALFGKPAIIIYKTSFITAFLAKKMLKTPFVSLPNILLNSEVYPELLQENCTADAILEELEPLLADHRRRDIIRVQLSEVRSQLGSPGAAERVAGILEEMVKSGE